MSLVLALLTVASLAVSAYATTIYDNVDNKTVNGVTAKLYYEADNAYYRRFFTSTTSNSRVNYIYAGILLENSLNNNYIGDDYADGHNLSSIEAYTTASYGRVTYVRATSTNKVGYSETDLKSDFGLRKIFTM